MPDDAAIRAHLLTAQAEITAALKLLDAIVVRPGDNLLSVLEVAPAGSTIAIDPAFVADLGFWSIDKPVTLTTTATIAPGRVTDALVAPTVRGCLTINADAVWLHGLRCELATNDGTAIAAGPLTRIDQCVVVGSANGGHRGISVNAPDIAITRSHVGNFWRDIDTQAIAGWMHTKRLRVEDCYLEASGENVLFGGADGPDEDSIPSDITIVDCTIVKPLDWRDKPGCTVKNLFELKNAKRVALQRCTLENVWVHGQIGYALVLTVRNQDNSNPWATIEDCVIEDCIVRHMAGGIQILGRDDGAGGPSQVMRGMTIRRNSFEDVNPPLFGPNGRQLFISSGPIDLVVQDNEWSGQYLNTALQFDRSEFKLEGFVYTGNRAHEGAYGIHGTDAPGLGVAALDFYAPGGYTWHDNTIVDDGEGWITYPPGTTLVPVDGQTKYWDDDDYRRTRV